MTTDEKNFALLGTDRWQSYAYFRAGVRYADEGNKRAAREMYYKALAEDPDNIGACLNLAILDIFAAAKDDESNPDALELLQNVKERTQDAEPTDHVSTWPPWYVATYQLAAAYDYQDKVWLAYPEARELVDKIENTIEDLNRKRRPWWKPWGRRPQTENEEILQYLNDLKPLAVIMLAAILIRRGRQLEADAELRKVTDDERLRHRVRYNLACYHSRLGEQKRGVARERAYKSALEDLRYAFERQRSLVEYARDDKSLRGVSKAKESEFNTLIKRYARSTLPQPADELSLAGLEIVGATHAKQLQQQGIVSRDDLLAKAATRAARRRLAEKLGISSGLLKRWALLADMMRVVGTDMPLVNLMVAANVDSLRALKESDPEKLALLLHQVNQARPLVKQLPEVETVRKWVREATSIKRIVKDKFIIW